jgi:cytochrome c oxidase assembly protein subunit 15
VGKWFLLASSLVLGIVVVGGITRLTESGLSITEWNLIRGMKWPSDQTEWMIEFEKYQQSPEYKMSVYLPIPVKRCFVLLINVC